VLDLCYEVLKTNCLFNRVRHDLVLVSGPRNAQSRSEGLRELAELQALHPNVSYSVIILTVCSLNLRFPNQMDLDVLSNDNVWKEAEDLLPTGSNVDVKDRALVVEVTRTASYLYLELPGCIEGHVCLVS